MPIFRAREITVVDGVPISGAQVKVLDPETGKEIYNAEWADTDRSELGLFLKSEIIGQLTRSTTERDFDLFDRKTQKIIFKARVKRRP